MSQPDIIILEDCGSGLYGKVYKARQPKLGRDVAVKIINSEWPNAADALSHARALIKVAGHQNIVTVHDVTQVTIEGFENDHEAIIMEWIDGESLGERFSGKKFSKEEADKICRGMLAGIEYMHSKEMAHGDLHPGNIMLMSDYTPKIIDIDPHQDNTLARLSTISKEGAVANDIGYFTRGAISVLQHTNIPRFQINELDTELSNADSLKQIRAIVEKFFNEPRPMTLPVHGNAAVEPSESLAEQVQNYIEDDKPARLRRLMLGQVKLIQVELQSDKYCSQEDINEVSMKLYVKNVEELMQPISQAIAVGAYWGEEAHSQLWIDCIESIANICENLKARNSNTPFTQLHLYPPMIMFYSAAMGAYWNNRYSTLRTILQEGELEKDYGNNLPKSLLIWKHNLRGTWNRFVVPNEGRVTPLSDHLENITRESMISLIPPQCNFEKKFNQFEYFIGALYCYCIGYVWAPVGSFIWKYSSRSGMEIDLGQELIDQASTLKSEWPPFKDGLFKRDMKELKTAVTKYEESLDAKRNEIHFS